jgi:hypothetical protein
MFAVIHRQALDRIEMEYIEMPGLRLAPDQIGRLCGLPQDICDGALTVLIQTGFLFRTEDGLLGRPSRVSIRRRQVIA